MSHTSLTTESTQTPSLGVKGRSLTQRAMQRFIRNKAAMLSLIILVCIIVLSFFPKLITPHGLEDISWETLAGNPKDYMFSSTHWFGVDTNGRDYLVRLLFGIRISIFVGFLAALVALTIGVLYGSISGFVGGTTDNVMMRIVEILYSLPFVFVVIILMTIFGRNVWLLFFAIGAIEWMTMARIVRAQTLSIKEKEYIEAARASGVKPFKIIRRHVIPNLIGPIIVYSTLTVPAIILVEAFLSFLGLGIQEPWTSLGILLNETRSILQVNPAQFLVTAAAMGTILLSLNFIGDGLRDAFDPKDY